MPEGENFISIGIGNAHACGVRLNGKISCIGSNAKGQATPPAGEFYAVITGGDHNCAQIVDKSDFRRDRTWVCWGDNSHGQATVPSVDIQIVTAGDKHTCGGSDVSGFHCWGDNSFGQTTVPAGVHSAVAGRNHNCTVNDNGTLNPTIVCWGDDSRGQATPPPGLPLSSSVYALEAGGDHTCILNAFYEIWCWGDATAGQSTPPRDSLAPFGITTGHGCGLKAFGSDTERVVCWGDEWGGALSTPPSGRFSGVFVGEYRTCVAPTDLSRPVICWGTAYEDWY